MMFPIIKIAIKVYDCNGVYKGISNLIFISKNKIKNGKKDIEGATFGVFQYEVAPFKDGYKMHKNPIEYK